MIGASFDSTKTPLRELLARAASSKLPRIKEATGKTVTCEPELFRAGVVVETYDKGPDKEWDAEDRLEEAAS